MFKLFRNVLDGRTQQRQQSLYSKLIRHEAKLGGQVFGEVPSNRRREFFCLDEYTWVWHEEWLDDKGIHHVQTTRYDVRPGVVIKSLNGHYSEVNGRELRRLKQAARAYVNRVNQEMYMGAISA
jgi:hypothetical protein